MRKLILSLSLLAVLTSPILAEQSTSATINVSIKDETGENNTVEIVSVDGAKLPAETKKTTNAKNFSFDPIIYDKVGEYEYEVFEHKGSAKYTTYDSEKYKVKVFVLQEGDELLNKVVVHKTNGEKVNNVEFTNITKKPVIKNDYNTGSDNKLFVYTGIIGLSAIGIIFVVTRKSAKVNKEETDGKETKF